MHATAQVAMAKGYVEMTVGDIVAVFRERHQFKPGDKIRLKPDERFVHLFDEPTGRKLDA